MSQRTKDRRFAPLSTEGENRLRRRIYAAYTVLVVTFVFLVGLALGIGRPRWVLGCIPVLIVVNTYAFYAVAAMRKAGYAARAQLRAGGYRVCLQCCYELQTGEQQGICSECGRAFEAAGLEAAWEGRYRDLLAESKSKEKSERTSQ